MTPPDATAQARPSLGALFLGFAKIGLMGFGGVAPVARHVIVEDRRWLSEQEYAALLSVGQVLPGPNVVNTSLMIGDRFHGLLGAATALTGIMAMPLVLLIVFATLYGTVAENPIARAAMAGAAAASAGLVIGMAIKMARKLKPGVVALVFIGLAFVAAGVLRLPLVEAIIVLAPLSILAAWKFGK